jgi:DNA-binding transcriptional MerR regulator
MATPATIRTDEPDEKLFRIGEVSRLTGIKAFVLRYWEQEIPALQPVKTPTGHRLYRREDIETVVEIKRLLYDEGFTLAGARKHLSESQPELASAQQTSLSPNDNGPVISPAPRPLRFSKARQQTLAELREELLAILTLLEGE